MSQREYFFHIADSSKIKKVKDQVGELHSESLLHNTSILQQYDYENF